MNSHLQSLLKTTKHSLPSAFPVDDFGGEFDHNDAWSALRAAATGDTSALDIMLGVRFSYNDVDGTRVEIIVR